MNRYLTEPSPVLSCIDAIGKAADNALEEIADKELDSNSVEYKILYSNPIKRIKREQSKENYVQNGIVDRVSLYIANYYVINEFVSPDKGGLMGKIKSENKISYKEENGKRVLSSDYWDEEDMYKYYLGEDISENGVENVSYFFLPITETNKSAANNEKYQLF